MVVVIALALIILLCLRKGYQPLKRKSPNLILLSAIGNLLFCVLMLLQMISLNGCMLHQSFSFCESEFLARLNCLMGFLLLTICEPLAVLPYLIRAVRLYVIFKSQDYYFKEKKKPKQWLKWIKEGTLIKLCILLITILLIFSVFSFVAYNFEERIFIYIPSYTIQACYTNSLYLPHEQIPPDVIDIIKQHTNYSVTLLIIINGLEGALFIYSLHKLRSIKSEFNIRKELTMVFGIWYILGQLTICFFIYKDNNSKWQWIEFLLVIRSISALIITSVPPLYQSYQNYQFILLPPNQDSIESLDMVLHIPIASEYFYDYLDKLSNDPDAPIFFSLYADLRYYDKACQEYDNSEIQDQIIKYNRAIAIKQDYINNDGKFHVDIDKDVKRMITMKFNNLQENLNQYLFIELYAFVLEKLREHFEMFKRSRTFVELEDEISRQEKLYEVLVDASIITN